MRNISGYSFRRAGQKAKKMPFSRYPGAVSARKREGDTAPLDSQNHSLFTSLKAEEWLLQKRSTK